MSHSPSNRWQNTAYLWLAAWCLVCQLGQHHRAAAAWNLPLRIEQAGQLVAQLQVRIEEDLPPEEIWRAVLAQARLTAEQCRDGFRPVPDETGGLRWTLRGPLELSIEQVGPPLTLDALHWVRTERDSSTWQISASQIPQALARRAEIMGQPTKPNVVVILCDDLRWNALSCMGHPHLRTPHIDQLAREGILFENAFCTTSLCSPSRASILSGLYAHRHGVTNNFTEFPADLPHFPGHLQQAGYETAYIGKWHMGENNDAPRPGFDWFVTHRGQGNYFDTEFNLHGQEKRTPPNYYTTAITDMAIEWLEKERDQPFLLMLGHKAPHSFYLPEPRYAHTFDHVEINYPHSAFDGDRSAAWVLQRQSTWHGIYGPLFGWRKEFPEPRAHGVVDFARMVRAYWGTILSVDDSVGRITECLRNLGVLDNTVVLFLGDNGLLEGEHGLVDKRTMHEPSIRIPMIMRYPRLMPIDRPQRITSQVLTLDVAPTVLELCSAPPLPDAQGQSWVPLIRHLRQPTSAAPTWRNAWLYHYNYEKQFPYTPNVRGIRTDQWKYIRYPHGDGGPDRHRAELYNLRDDPDERHNLIDQPEHPLPEYPVIAQQLQQQLQSLLEETGPERQPAPLDEGVQEVLPPAAIR